MWTRYNEATVVEHKVRIRDSLDPNMFTHRIVECHYEICSSLKAWNITGDIEPDFEPFLETELPKVTYLVYKGEVKFELPVIHFFCFDTPTSLFNRTVVTGPGIGRRELTEKDINSYGMTWTESEFKINAANFEWYNYTFEITLRPSVE